MRTFKTILLAMLVLAALTATIWANAPKSAIVGSAHDLTTYTWTATTAGAASSTITTNLCYFCHIVHKTGAAPISSAPGYMLWNHTLSAVTSYGYYSSDTFNQLLQAATDTITDLGSGNALTYPPLTVSNLCLSCHDGSVAIASFYQTGFALPATGSYWYNGHGSLPGSTYMYTGFQISDLSRSHPVNFAYTPALATAAGGGLLSPASANSVDGNNQVPLYGQASLMECTTCHDVHNGTFLKVTQSSGSTTTIFPFPRTLLSAYSGAGGFCCYCHT